MKINEISELSSSDLIQKEKTLKKELFDLNYLKRVGTVEKPSRFKQIKKDIARILTILKKREIENERDGKKKK
jgi:large subunit ribosomal protein L29